MDSKNDIPAKGYVGNVIESCNSAFIIFEDDIYTPYAWLNIRDIFLSKADCQAYIDENNNIFYTELKKVINELINYLNDTTAQTIDKNKIDIYIKGIKNIQTMDKNKIRLIKNINEFRNIV